MYLKKARCLKPFFFFSTKMRFVLLFLNPICKLFLIEYQQFRHKQTLTDLAFTLPFKLKKQTHFLFLACFNIFFSFLLFFKSKCFQKHGRLGIQNKSWSRLAESKDSGYFEAAECSVVLNMQTTRDIFNRRGDVLHAVALQHRTILKKVTALTLPLMFSPNQKYTDYTQPLQRGM